MLGHLTVTRTTHVDFESTTNRNVYINVGTDRRVTARVTKNKIAITGIERLPSGREIAGWFQTTHIINIYAPSGTSKRVEGEKDEFYTLDLPHLLRHLPNVYITGGDFNCVAHLRDRVGTPDL